MLEIAGGIILAVLLLPVVLWLLAHALVLVVIVLWSPFLLVGGLIGKLFEIGKEPKDPRSESWLASIKRVTANGIGYAISAALVIGLLCAAVVALEWIKSLR